MQKRKTRFNILDLAIVAAVICAVAAVIFRNDIAEAFGTPETIGVELTAESGYITVSEAAAFRARVASAQLPDGSELRIEEALISHPNEEGLVSLSIRCSFFGYKRIGRYYDLNGERVSLSSVVSGGGIEFTVRDIYPREKYPDSGT